MATCKQVYLMRGKSAGVKVDRGTTGQLQETYKAHFTDTNVTAVDVMNATSSNGNMPPFFTAIGTWVLTGMEPKQDEDDPTVWTNTVTYTLPVPGVEAAPATPDPDGERWAIEITIASVPFEEEIQRDINGNMLVNTAWDPIEGVTAPRFVEEITISFTTNVIDWTGIDAAFGALGRGTTNSVAVTMTINGQSRTFAIGTLLFCNYTMSITQDPTAVSYPKMVYHLRWRAEGWKRTLANKGLNGLTFSTNTRFPLRDKEGHPVTTPKWLATNTASHDVTMAAISTVGEVVSYTVYETTDLGSILVWDLNT